MAKIMKSYRLHQFTLDRLSELAKWYNVGDTTAIEIAITEAYFSEKARQEEKKAGD